MSEVNYEEFEKYEEESEEDLKTVPEAFSEAVIWGTDWTVETINSQLSKGNIDLNLNSSVETHGVKWRNQD